MIYNIPPNMPAENHTAWGEAAYDNQEKLIDVFDRDGVLVVGKVEDWISYCSKGGGGAVSNPGTRKIVGDVPVYLCAVLPGSKIGPVNSNLMVEQYDAPGYYRVLLGRSSASSAPPGALLPSQMGAWWWLPFVGSVALAIIC